MRNSTRSWLWSVGRRAYFVNRSFYALRPTPYGTQPNEAGDQRTIGRLSPQLVFIPILLIAFFFRFYRLADHPLGLFFDPAINGLDAVRLMQRGGHVLFFPTNGGRESFFIYLLIPYIWLFGATPFAVRALTATISLLTVALLIGFLNHVPTLHSPPPDLGQAPPDRRPVTPAGAAVESYRLWLATLGGLALAVSPWHIMVSRLGQRPILVSFFAVLLFWAFLKGRQAGQKRWFILAGLWLGLAGYTYAAARLLPVILVLAVLPEFFPIRRRRRAGEQGLSSSSRPTGRLTATHLLLLISTTLLVYAPLAWYLIRHPAQFTNRAASVMIWNFLDVPGDVIAELGRNGLRVAGFFCCVGSPNPIFGFPTYPGLSFIVAPLLLIGLLVALKNWRDLFYRLTALWQLIGVMPSIIAIEAPHPLRMIVAVPPTAILIALGAIHVALWAAQRTRVTDQGASNASKESRRTPVARRVRVTLYICLFLILLPTISLFRAYFINWTQLQTTQGVYDYGAVAIRDTILNLAGEERPIYLPLARFNDSTLLFYLSDTFQRQANLSPPPAGDAMVIAPEKNESDAVWVRLYKGTATVIPPLTAEGRRLMQTALADAAAPIRTISGETVARLADLPVDPVEFLQRPTDPLTAAFGPVRLTGLNYPDRIDPAPAHIPVTLFWQAIKPMKVEYEVILHLVDDKRQLWGDGSGRPTAWAYPTSFWRPGLDEIATHHLINLETDTPPPGRYWLAISLFDPAANQRLTLTNAPDDAPDTLFGGSLKVPLPPPDPASIDSLLTEAAGSDQDILFGESIRLAGAALTRPTIAAGESINLNLLWEAQTRPDLDYTVFIHLLDAEGEIVVGHDNQPVFGRYPTSIWDPQELILDAHTLSTPASLPAGRYRLALGLYHQPSGKRLPLHFADGRRADNGRLILSSPVIVQ